MQTLDSLPPSYRRGGGGWKMVKWVEALATKPDHLRPILRIRMVEGENALAGCPLTSTHGPGHTCTHTRIDMHPTHRKTDVIISCLKDRRKR